MIKNFTLLIVLLSVISLSAKAETSCSCAAYTDNNASTRVRDMLNRAQDVVKLNIKEAEQLLLGAMNYSNCPNVVAEDPTLHSDVLKLITLLLKQNPQIVDQSFVNDYNLYSIVCDAPVTPARGVINPSAE
jgi:hypothetical protein